MASLSKMDFALLGVAGWLLYKILVTARLRLRTTRLKGPKASNWMLGVSREVFTGDSGALYEDWMDKYGVVYQVPTALGSRRTILCDPKAIAHFYSKETYVYIQNTFTKNAIANLVGKGLIWAEGDSHKRQRRALTPAFSNASIRNLTPIFYDSAYKVKAVWDNLFESASGDEVIIDVQKWMNSVSLDSVGIAGFSHAFGSLEGKHSEVAELFDSFGSLKPPSAFAVLIPLLAPLMPMLARLPTKRSVLVKKLHGSMQRVADVLLQRSRSEKAEVRQEAGMSIIGALMKAENAQTELTMSEEEVLAQMKVLILAGYETTSVSLTWALIELSLHPEKQDRLREELSQFTTRDPSYDQLTNGLPYLDAITREILRLHPPLAQTMRIAAQDDVIPLSTPVTTASGETVDRIHVARGANIAVPIRCMNRATSIWGPDAKEFVPERWLDDDEKGLPARAREIQGYHHLLTFVDGPRTCLGKGFALAEFKSVLSVLIRNFTFSMRDGPETKLDSITTILPRPKVAGEEGYALPLRVRRVDV